MSSLSPRFPSVSLLHLLTFCCTQSPPRTFTASLKPIWYAFLILALILISHLPRSPSTPLSPSFVLSLSLSLYQPLARSLPPLLPLSLTPRSHPPCTPCHHASTRLGSNTFGARVLYWTAGSFLALHTIPTVEIYFALLPVYVALYRGTAAIGATDGIGLAVCLIATYLEWLADRQMRLWRQKNPNSTVRRRLFSNIGYGVRLRSAIWSCHAMLWTGSLYCTTISPHPPVIFLIFLEFVLLSEEQRGSALEYACISLSSLPHFHHYLPLLFSFLSLRLFSRTSSRLPVGN